MNDDAYEAVLADLRAQRDQIDSAIAFLEQRRGGQTIQGATIPSGTTLSAPTVAVGLPADAFFGMRLLDAVRKYLAIMKRPQSPKEIVDALERGGFPHTSKRFYGAVYNALTRAATTGELVRVKDDWGLTEWYPNLRREKRREEKRPDEAERSVAEE